MIWAHTQNISQTRLEVAAMLGLSVNNVRVIWHEGSSSFGRMGIDDAAGGAAILTKEMGKPVRLQWMRHDEHSSEPPQKGMTHDLKATVDSSGRITAWRDENWSPFAKSDINNMLPWILLGTAPPVAPGSGRLSQPFYVIPNLQLTGHLTQPLVRALYMRSVSDIQDVFVNESFMDELAAAAGIDPIDFRLNHLTDPRTIAVLQAVKQLSGWQTRPSPANGVGGAVMRGRGVAIRPMPSSYYANCCPAVVAEVEVTRKTGAVRVTKVWTAVELGTIVNPDTVRSQLEGGMIMGISRALKEAVRFGRNRVTSVDWVTYPITRFMDMPDSIDIAILPRPGGSGIPDGGIGEPAALVQPGAIANAIFDATGVRMRELPFTPARVRAYLKAAGVA
jgi:CO/xanthine dehydrogenase Mo-binding subunit